MFCYTPSYYVPKCSYTMSVFLQSRKWFTAIQISQFHIHFFLTASQVKGFYKRWKKYFRMLKIHLKNKSVCKQSVQFSIPISIVYIASLTSTRRVADAALHQETKHVFSWFWRESYDHCISPLMNAHLVISQFQKGWWEPMLIQTGFASILIVYRSLSLSSKWWGNKQ